jgi:hypothetical protein
MKLDAGNRMFVVLPLCQRQEQDEGRGVSVLRPRDV